jgi:hypothetical protein
MQAKQFSQRVCLVLEIVSTQLVPSPTTRPCNYNLRVQGLARLKSRVVAFLAE